MLSPGFGFISDLISKFCGEACSGFLLKKKNSF